MAGKSGGSRSGSWRRIRAIASRIVTQFRRDPRTIALILVAPILLMTLLGYVIADKTVPVSIGFVDLDEGATLATASVDLSPVLRRALEDEDLTLETYTDPAAMLDDITSGALRAGVTVSGEFTNEILSGEGLSGVKLTLEGSDAMLSGDIARRFGRAVQAFPAAAVEELKSLMPPDSSGTSSGASGAAPGAGSGQVAPPTGALLSPVGQPEIEYVYGGADLGTLNYFAPGYVAFIVYFLTFLLTSVSFLRERSSGTMERLLASPIQRSEIVVGYLLGFGIFALIQSVVILLFTIYVLGVSVAGSLGAVFLLEAALTAVAVVMGIFFSFYARNELQVVQFIPIVIIPQAILSGFITPLETMYAPLRWLARVMPMTYANRALRAVMIKGTSLGDPAVLIDLGIMLGFAVLFTLLASRLIKRQVA